MSNMQIDSVLAQIRSLQQQTRVGAPQPRPAQELDGAGSFASVMRQGLDRVNEAQAKATNIATAFEKGVPGIELSQVMLESQKASVSFRAVTEVRNRLVSAYQEIMNMPI